MTLEEKARVRAHEDGMWCARHGLSRNHPLTLTTKDQVDAWYTGYDLQVRKIA